MAENTRIEWADHTFNPWYGCTKVSPGCDHCYAEARMDTRLHRVNWGAGAPRVRTKDWKDPERWNRRHEAFHAAHGRRQRVFCASLADVFDNQVPETWRTDLFALIEQTPNLDWLLLTKRIGNAAQMLPLRWLREPRHNVWLGATVVNQEEADRDVVKLQKTPARVRFLSMEPLLGPVDLRYLQPGDPPTEINALAGTHGVLRPHRGECNKVDWVIVGGESGPHARPMHPDWARSLCDQCAAAGVPFLFKQWGEWMPPESPTTSYPGKDWRDVVDSTGEVRKVAWVGDRVLESSRQVVRIGKKAAGRLLDGVEHNGFPEVR